MPRLVLYRFRYRDPIDGKWVRARYVAQVQEIAAQHAEYELIEPPEIRDVPDDDALRYFSPFRARQG